MIYPNWPAPDNIKAMTTTRNEGGVSVAPFDSLNLADHLGDDHDAVASNRQQLFNLAQLPNTPLWLSQVHGVRVINSVDWQMNIEADASFSSTLDHVCCVMTADCLPILVCNRQGTMVAAIHAGWRSLADGIIEATLAEFKCEADDILIWLGPAIGPNQFEVGLDVYQAFTAYSPLAAQAFKQTDKTHYLADIYQLARQRLQALNINTIYGGDYCTLSDPKRFFSYRRDDLTGRMASMIWIAPK